MARLLVAMLVGFAPLGCGGAAPSPVEPAPELRVEAADPDTGVGLTVSADRGAVSTVDRVTVEIVVSRPAGLAVSLAEPDWAAAGWEIVATNGPRLDAGPDGRIEERRVLTLEPFLAGTYEIPPVVASAGDAAGGGWSVATGVMRVEVRSVLEPGDEGDLAGPAEVVGPPPADAPRTGLMIAAGVVGLGVVALLWRLTRSGGPDDEGQTPLAPVEALRRVAEGRAPGEDELGMVHRAVDRLAAEARGAGAWRAVLDRLEQARFGPRAGDADDGAARAIAREALALAEGGA
jgi:hypothetical protein